jgi:hypothetical protein
VKISDKEVEQTGRKAELKVLVVSIRHVATPDAGARLSRAIDTLLRLAEKDSLPSNDNKGSC